MDLVSQAPGIETNCTATKIRLVPSPFFDESRLDAQHLWTTTDMPTRTFCSLYGRLHSAPIGAPVVWSWYRSACLAVDNLLMCVFFRRTPVDRDICYTRPT